MSTHASNYFATALTSDHMVMLEPWMTGVKSVDGELLRQSKDAVMARLRREDDGAVWLMGQVASHAPGLVLNDHADTVMMVLARHGTPKIMARLGEWQGLVATPESCFLTDIDGNTALLVAVEEGRAALALALLDAGAEAEHHNVRGKTIIDLAHECSSPLSMIEALTGWLEAHDKVTPTLRKELRDFFYDALISGNMELAARLREYAMDLREEMVKAITQNQPVAVVDALLHMGADVHGQDDQGHSWVELARLHRAGAMMGILRLRQAQASKS